MPNPTGFFQLQSPLDLLAKMEADCQRLSENPINVYAAFDFFVAAAHLPEWLGQVQCAPGQAKDERGAALRNICDHLANGAKHFQADDHHNAVGVTSVRPPARFGLLRFGASRFGDASGALVVGLAGTEATNLDGASIAAVELADMMLTYWKTHPAIERAAKLLRESDPAC